MYDGRNLYWGVMYDIVNERFLKFFFNNKDKITF